MVLFLVNEDEYKMFYFKKPVILPAKVHVPVVSLRRYSTTSFSSIEIGCNDTFPTTTKSYKSNNKKAVLSQGNRAMLLLFTTHLFHLEFQGDRCFNTTR